MPVRLFHSRIDRLALTVIEVIRWTHLSTCCERSGGVQWGSTDQHVLGSASSFDGLEGDIASWTNDAIEGFIRIFAGCLVGKSSSPTMCLDTV